MSQADPPASAARQNDPQGRAPPRLVRSSRRARAARALGGVVVAMALIAVGAVQLGSSGRGTNFRIEDSELAPSQVNVFQNDICGFDFTAVGINSHSGVDTADISGSDVTILDSWLHATTSFPVDPNHGGGPTHNDGIQITAGSRIQITHNTIAGGSNAAIQITQDNGHVSDVQIDDNLLGGGSCTVRMNAKPLPHMFGIEMNVDRFTGTSTIPGCDVLISRRVRLSAAGNTRVGSDKSVKIARAG